MDLESLLRQSDPANRADLPDFESVVGHRVHDEIMSRTFDREGSRVRLWNRGRLRVSVAAIFAVAGVITLVATLVPGTNGSSQSAAAAVLNHLASQAAQEPTTLGAGQYYYTEVQEPTTDSAETLPSGAVLYSYFLGTVQTWVAADGSGRQVTTTDPTPRFFTNADRALWIAAGKPPLPPSPLSSTQDFGPGSASEVNGPVPLYDVSGLPTDPTALAVVLGNEDPGRTSLGTLPAGISALDSGTLFSRTVALLQGPDVGQTPALRSALYQVLATVPGIQLLGTTTDPAGQSGLGLQLVNRIPAGTDTFTCGSTQPGGSSNEPTTTVTMPYPASATTFTIVVDPETTTLLSSEESYAPSVGRTLVNACSPQQSVQTTRLTPNWTTVLAEGIVDSQTATPSTGNS